MADGLFFYRRIAEEGKQYMKSGARIYLEIGYDQGRSVPEILTTAGFTNVTVYQDLAGLDRVVRGEYQSV
jgi:release factor glutamine methyltransferase